MGARPRRDRTPLAVLRALPWALLRLGTAGGGRARGPLRVWLWWERLTTWWWRPRPARDGGVLLYHLARHRGPAVVLDDGTTVRPGDRLVEIHLDNRALVAHDASPQASAWRVASLLGRDLDALAARIAAHAEHLHDARAVHGITLLGPASRTLGFEVRPLPRTAAWALVRYFMVGLLAIYHPDGWRRVERLRERAWPSALWMSRARLLERLSADPGARR